MVVGIAHAGLAPEIEIAGVRPNLMLVAVVLVTALLGFGPGIVWAFAGGLTANLISTTPIGSIPAEPAAGQCRWWQVATASSVA